MLQDYNLKPPVVPVFKLDSMSPADLIDLRGQINRALKLDLSQLNLTEELALQFQQAKLLLDDILNDDETPANQKAQVINSATSILANISKAQAELYSAERLKKLELATQKALKTLPKAAQEAFFTIFEGHLGQPNP